MKKHLKKDMTILATATLLLGTLALFAVSSAARAAELGTSDQGTGGTATGQSDQGTGGTPNNQSDQGTGGTVTLNAPNKTFTLTNPLKVSSVGGLAKTIVEVVSYVAIILAVLVYIYIGFQYVTAAAAGNSNKIGELHGWLLWATVGVAVIIGARVIIDVVLSTLNATGAVNPQVIEAAQNANRR